MTGMAYPPEWAIAHQRALCSAKHFSILRRVPRRGLLANVWSPKSPLRFQSFAPLLLRTSPKQPQAAGLQGDTLLDAKQQRLLEAEPCGMADEALDAVNLSPLAQGVGALSTPEVPRKLEFEVQAQQDHTDAAMVGLDLLLTAKHPPACLQVHMLVDCCLWLNACA